MEPKPPTSPLVVITGCGTKPVRHVFTHDGSPTHALIRMRGADHKMNIGAAGAHYLSLQGVPVLMVARRDEMLEQLCEGLVELGSDPTLLSTCAIDATTEEGVHTLVERIQGRPFHWVQSLGLGAGTYNLPDDNPYQPIRGISRELLEAELGIVPATNLMLQQFLPLLEAQAANDTSTKIVVITSMSGIRGYHFGGAHVAAKHAIEGYVEGVRRELEEAQIEIRVIRAGAIDTGLYDSESVRAAMEVLAIKDDMWSGHPPTFASPLEVATCIGNALFNDSCPFAQEVRAPNQN